MAKRLLDQEARQPAITVHEQVQGHEAEGGDGRGDQGIDVSHGLVGLIIAARNGAITLDPAPHRDERIRLLAWRAFPEKIHLSD
nr:hypothetical protein [Pseudomonas synxantha]